MKRFLISLVALGITSVCFAQIQSRFFGFTLGSTTKSTVISSLKSQGYDVLEFSNSNHKGVSISNVSWAGEHWSWCFFDIIDNKLESVRFQTNALIIGDAELKNRFKDFVYRSTNKYGKYYAPKYSNDNEYTYIDGKTCLSVHMHQGSQSGISHVNFLTITYTNEALSKRAANERARKRYNDM